MKVLIVFKNGEEVKKENVKQVFCNPKEDELFLVYGPFECNVFCMSEIDFYNVDVKE